MNEALTSIVLKHANAREILGRELIQELWSGYGELTRITTDKGSVILKLIEFPEQKSHPRGWGTDLGHVRKVRSYKVEKSWYQNLVEVPGARLAKCLAVGEVEGKEFLLLEDLQNFGFKPSRAIKWHQVEMCLCWLAHFHKFFVGKSSKGLWPIGTYWHLETRPDELATMEEGPLKEKAHLIDKKLNEAKFKTIVHGDAKLSNFLFNMEKAAAVDFQYVGGGVGIKDVAYFLSSIYEEDELASMEEQCLRTYFKYLELPDVEKEWRELYPYAWTDFYRFLKGWSPGHWKINSYSETMAKKVLECL